MFKTRNVAAAIASLALTGAAAGPALAQNAAMDVRQEDRLAERQVEAMEERAEVKLPVPRTAAGAVDVTALLASVQAQIAQGAREIQFRGVTLSAAEVQSLLLNTNTAPNTNLLRSIANLLPNDGVERDVRLRGAADVRVQRQENGMLRVRIEGVDLSSLSATQRAGLAQQLAAQLGLDRVRIRGVDADGNRVRLEFRADKGLVENESSGRGRSGAQVARSSTAAEVRDRQEDRRDDRREDRGIGQLENRGRIERAERIERVERPERTERVERADRPDRSGRR